MPVDNATYLPASSQFRTVMTLIGTTLTPIMQTVRYFLRLPEDETSDVVAYIEFESPINLVNESIESSQRSWMGFKVVVYLYITEGDTRTMADLIHRVATTLFAPAAIVSYRNAFSTDNGFSIENLTVTEVGFGVEYCQAKIVLDCMFFHPDA
jgi:hypothetical protein